MSKIVFRKGFTLVELLMGMALTVLVAGILYLMQSTGVSTVNKGTTQLLLTSEVRNKMELIVKDLRNTKEVLDIKSDYIKIRTYKYSIDKQEPGEDALVTVEYEVERTPKRNVLWRSENRENPAKLLSFESIDENLFKPYYELYNEQSPVGWSYYPFDMVSNDSGQRARITFIKIMLKFKQGKEKAALSTSVTLKPALSRVRQPNWKLR
ncbi:MAG: prepilin-type N-terminal cleavage/methylation domain-containing protein [Candidatus Riflebacteria bacterium]|nr:prepilin-type N-terminal cleavage/methylation domain-containing protein [Candidatus Riflebacteria bacterium]